MAVPPVAKLDLLSRSQIDALLIGIASPNTPRPLLAPFEGHGLLGNTELDPHIAVDELGRLRRNHVNETLNAFDQNVRGRLSLSANSYTLSPEFCLSTRFSTTSAVRSAKVGRYPECPCQS